MHARGFALVALLVAMAMAAGCGAASESGRPADQILRDALAAAQRADSVHIAGTVARGTTTATLDLVLTSSGDGQEKITGAGQDIAVVRVGQTLFVKGVSGPGAGGGFQRMSMSDPRARQLAQQVDKNAVFAQLIKAGETPRVTGSVPVSGQPAIQLTPGAGTGVLSVADDSDHPYPLMVSSAAPATGQPTPGENPAGSLTFSDWDTHIVITAPTGGGS